MPPASQPGVPPGATGSYVQPPAKNRLPLILLVLVLVGGGVAAGVFGRDLLAGKPPQPTPANPVAAGDPAAPGLFSKQLAKVQPAPEPAPLPPTNSPPGPGPAVPPPPTPEPVAVAPAPPAPRNPATRPLKARKMVSVGSVYEVFFDRGQVYLRAGSDEGVTMGARVQVVGPAEDGKRPLYAIGTAMEVTPHLTRLHTEVGPKVLRGGGDLFGAYDGRAAVAAAPAQPADPAPAHPPAPPPAVSAVPLKGKANMGAFNRLYLTNSNDFNWTKCELRLPNNKRYTLGPLAAQAEDTVNLGRFVQDGVETEVEVNFVNVKCAEGSAKFFFGK